MEWSQEKILYFIEQYRKKTVLWDPQDPQHYIKVKKNDAWQQLAEETENTIEECKRKITSLLASLRREKAKILKSKGTGKGTDEVYNSTWFAFEALAFVLDRNKPRSTRDTIETRSEIEASEEKDMGANGNETGDTGEKTRSEASSNDNKISTPRAKKIKINMKSPEEMLASAYNILEKAAHKPETTTTTRPAVDESDSFGLFVSNKLKNYSHLVRSTVQHRISNILFEADQGRYGIIYPGMDARCDSGSRQSFVSYSSGSTYPPTPSPQHSTQSLADYGQSQTHGLISSGSTCPSTSSPQHSTQSLTGYGQSQTYGLVSSASTCPPTSSPQLSTHSLEESEVSNYPVQLSTTARPSRPYSLTPLLPQKTRSLTQEEQEESQGFFEEYSDLIN